MRLKKERPVKKKDMIRLKRNDAGIIAWIYSNRPEDGILVYNFRDRLKLNSMKECFQYTKFCLSGKNGRECLD